MCVETELPNKDSGRGRGNADNKLHDLIVVWVFLMKIVHGTSDDQTSVIHSVKTSG